MPSDVLSLETIKQLRRYLDSHDTKFQVLYLPCRIGKTALKEPMSKPKEKTNKEVVLEKW